LGVAFVSYVHNVTYVSPCIKYRSLARRDIPAMNSAKLQITLIM